MPKAQCRETLELMGQEKTFSKENWEGVVTRTEEPGGVFGARDLQDEGDGHKHKVL